ncbi:protein YOP1 homolog [Hylaeus volcanicus]|uniref:protein YOP1 homolog n=1 Tax=Hylaeus volcanicus TaxID=313075 RepID=UPI0023B85170|nr:protein YOP1 homolog [Hylaeus volcanicus]
MLLNRNNCYQESNSQVFMDQRKTYMYRPGSNRFISNTSDSYEKFVTIIDQYISDFSFIRQLSARFNIRPTYIPVFALLIFLIILGVFDSFLTSATGFFYPAWQSFKAIERPENNAHTQWLTYWVVYAFCTLIEMFGGILLSWIPCYHIFKIIFFFWLFLPHFQGASFIYAHFIRPILLQYEMQIDQTIHRVAKTAVNVASSIQCSDEIMKNPNERTHTT